MEGVRADTHVESIFSAGLYQVLVGADTGSLQSLRGQLFLLVRHEMNTQREVIYMGLLTSQVIDTDLRV